MPERERVALRRTEFGFVFQQHFLINYLTALENVMVAAPLQDKAHAEQAKALLAEAGHTDTEFEIISIDDDWRRNTTDATAAQMRDAGINVKRKVIPG